MDWRDAVLAYPGRRPVMTRAEHNAGRWLVVRWAESGRAHGSLAGWYVVRVCPCHPGQRVTLPLPSEAEAARVRRVLLGLEPARRWDRTREWEPLPQRPAAVLPGQVWRRNRYRNGRYFQVLAVGRDRVEIATVERAAAGWVRVARKRGGPQPIELRRLLHRPSATAAWPYTCVEEGS